MHITKDNLDLKIFENIAFLQYAVPGAMGNEGGVYIYTLNGESHYFNTFDDISYEELEVLFPGMRQTQWAIDDGLINNLSNIDIDGWYYYNLRYGNHLIVSGKVMNGFVERVGRDAFLYPWQLYQNWEKEALEVLKDRNNN